ncbi:MAG: hypothetical protein JOY80_10785, partial [Candidatus Dormibacteraeota bacterium]|nr:hypothetical protein [Candidatus Dormibacteraeota bacterium]
MAARPGIAVQPDRVLPLTASVGLNPALTNMKKMYEAGTLAIVQGVGYDKPTYSHFEGMHVWQYADPAREQTEGWLGKLLATQIDTQGHPLTACALGEPSIPPELGASGATVSVIQSAQTYDISGDAATKAAAPALYRSTPGVY